MQEQLPRLQGGLELTIHGLDSAIAPALPYLLHPCSRPASRRV
jgi:hypothetical protein